MTDAINNDGQQRVQWGTLVLADLDTNCDKADGSGTYKGAEIMWKYHGMGNAQTMCIHENVFTNLVGAKVILEALSKGDEFCFTQVKKGKYWNTQEFAAGRDTLQVQGAPAQAASGGGAASGGKGNWPSNTFPTPKDDKGIAISRAHAVTSAIKLIELSGGNEGRAPSELVALAINIARDVECYTTGHEGE